MKSGLKETRGMYAMKSAARWLVVVIAILCVLGGGFLYRYRVEEESRVGAEIQTIVTAETFSHTLFDQVLQAYVDEQGRVDYAALKQNPQQLEAYLDAIAVISPNELPTGRAALASWINAYNALTIKGVLDHYPTTSVRKIKPYLSFFSRIKFRVGNQDYTLNDIEHGIIRGEFAEPRIHFALVCASGGCPILQNRAYLPETLDEQLENATSGFINNPEKVRLDRENRVLYLSKIFEWYTVDFEQTHDSLLDFVMAYRPETDAVFLKNEDVHVQYLPYDWELNDQKQK